MLIISYILVSIFIFMIGISVDLSLQSILLFCFLFSINGALQSTGWPSIVTIFSNWFGKKRRGTLIGVWSTSGSSGNILGALLTSFCTSSLHLSWNHTFIVIGLFCFFQAVINWFLIIEHPASKNITVEELDA